VISPERRLEFKARNIDWDDPIFKSVNLESSRTVDYGIEVKVAERYNRRKSQYASVA
jgi:hypothetical protein